MAQITHGVWTRVSWCRLPPNFTTGRGGPFMPTWTLARALLSICLGLACFACTGPAPGATDDGGMTSGDGGGASCTGCTASQICDNGTCRDLPQTCPCPKQSYCDLAANTCRAG